MKIRIGKIIFENIEIFEDEIVENITSFIPQSKSEWLDCKGSPVVPGKEYTIDSENQTPASDSLLFDMAIDGSKSLALINCLESGISQVSIKSGEKSQVVKVHSHWLTPIEKQSKK